MKEIMEVEFVSSCKLLVVKGGKGVGGEGKAWRGEWREVIGRGESNRFLI